MVAQKMNALEQTLLLIAYGADDALSSVEETRSLYGKYPGSK